MKRTHKPFDVKAALAGNPDLAKRNPGVLIRGFDANNNPVETKVWDSKDKPHPGLPVPEPHLVSVYAGRVKDAPTASKALKQAKKVGAQDKLRNRFLNHWNALNGPRLTPEYRFHHERMWRWDFCIPERKIAVEVDGGAFMKGKGGGHNRGVGKGKDEEKRNAATAMGWKVFVFSEKTLKPEFISVAVNCCKVGTMP